MFARKFTFIKNSQEKDLTDWILKGASGFGFDYQTVTVGSIHCRWKKDVEIKDTYVFSILKTCYKVCFDCERSGIITYQDTDEFKFERTHTKTLQMDHDVPWEYGYNPPGSSTLAKILDAATITNAEREKCSKARGTLGF